MQKLTHKLFLDYLEEQNISTNEEYSKVCKKSLEKELEIRKTFSKEQANLFEELFELTSQIHYMEVKDAFEHACLLFINHKKII